MKNMDLENFDWGVSSRFAVEVLKKEVFNSKVYEKYFSVEDGDIVVDLGATVGDFTFSILNKNPKHCYVVEPLGVFFDSLKKNLEGHQVSFSNTAISSEKYLDINWDNHLETIKPITFKEFITHNRLKKIDFLKVDCEGGEYDVFKENNIPFLLSVPKIVTEFQLTTPLNKEKFRYFRDNTLKNFSKFEVNSYDGVDIKWDLWNEHFIQYYKEVLIYIDNRS